MIKLVKKKIKKRRSIWWTPSFKYFLKRFFLNVERVKDKQLFVVEVSLGQNEISEWPSARFHSFLSSNKNCLER